MVVTCCCAAPAWAAATRVNRLSLVRVEAAGPRLLWQREPTAWEAEEARWATPNRVMLKRRHALPDGTLPDDARVTYDELRLPR